MIIYFAKDVCLLDTLTRRIFTDLIQFLYSKIWKVQTKTKPIFLFSGLPTISNSHPYHLSSLIGKNTITLDCISTGNPIAGNTWYQNSTKLNNKNSSWLNITSLYSENTNLYQCISSNEVGAVMKLVFVTLGITGDNNICFDSENFYERKSFKRHS
jgi:hypothetical protein